MIAERALLTDEQAREVVARGRLARAPAGAHDAPVRRDDGEAEHVLAHRAVADRVGTGGARRGHAADRRVGAGIDREEQSGALQIGVQLLARHARLDAAVEVVGVHLDDPVHRREVEAHAPVECGDVALERRADAEGDDRHACRVAQPHDRGHLFGRLRIDDDVGRRRVGEALAVAVLLAHRRVGHRALAVVGDEPPDDCRDGIRCGLRAGFGVGGHRHCDSSGDYFTTPSTANTSTGALLPLIATGPSASTAMRSLKRAARRAVDQDRLPGDLGVRLEPRRQVDRVADAGVGRALVRAGVARHHVARGDADADADLRLAGGAALDVEERDRLLHLQRRAHRARAVVGQRQRRAEDRHQPVADHQADDAAVRADRVEHQRVLGVEELDRLLGRLRLRERA